VEILFHRKKKKKKAKTIIGEGIEKRKLLNTVGRNTN
jgi:hypothetical protein